jgi:phosphohistidine phosphatase SixA
MGGGPVRYLVRHADAGDKHLWDGPDDDRPLSIAGHREAEGLIAQLDGYAISEIISSPAVRCWQTVRPLAEQRHLAIRTDTALTVNADPNLAVALLLDPRTDNVMLCTHGELIGPLLARLQKLGAPIGDEATWPKGSVWALEAVDGQITRATFLPPRRLDDFR